MPGILVVEDDENLNRGITFSLKKSGYEVFSAESVKKAKRIASDNNVDVTICDVNLPDGNGLEFVRWMRCNYNTYIICLTALDQEMDQVMGYEAGADDYMTKPFSPNELVARVKAHISRYDTLTSKSGDVITVGKLMIDKDAHKVTVDGKEISLTAKEYDLLLFLAENPNHTFSKEVLFDRIWGMDAIGDVSTVTVHIQRVRDKINTENERYIETIWGVGYRFNI